MERRRCRSVRAGTACGRDEYPERTLPLSRRRTHTRPARRPFWRTQRRRPMDEWRGDAQPDDDERSNRTLIDGDARAPSSCVLDNAFADRPRRATPSAGRRSMTHDRPRAPVCPFLLAPHSGRAADRSSPCRRQRWRQPSRAQTTRSGEGKRTEARMAPPRGVVWCGPSSSTGLTAAGPRPGRRGEGTSYVITVIIYQTWWRQRQRQRRQRQTEVPIGNRLRGRRPRKRTRGFRSEEDVGWPVGRSADWEAVLDVTHRKYFTLS